MHASSGCPTVAACRPVWGYTPAARLADDTSSFGVLPPIHPATSAGHTPGCRRRSGRPRLRCRRWPGSTYRRVAAHPPDTLCRTARRSGTWAPSSLWHVTLPVASQPSLEVRGSRQSPGCRHVLRYPWNQGPFPPPALPGFDGTMGLSDFSVRLACPSRASSWVTHPRTEISRVAPDLPVQTCRRHYPGGTVGGIGLLP